MGKIAFVANGLADPTIAVPNSHIVPMRAVKIGDLHYCSGEAVAINHFVADFELLSHRLMSPYRSEAQTSPILRRTAIARAGVRQGTSQRKYQPLSSRYCGIHPPANRMMFAILVISCLQSDGENVARPFQLCNRKYRGEPNFFQE